MVTNVENIDVTCMEEDKVRTSDENRSSHLENILGVIEEAKQISVERFDETLRRIEENCDNYLEKCKEGFIDLDFTVFDIDMPEMKIFPTEDEINKTVIGFLSTFVDFKKDNSISSFSDKENDSNVKYTSPLPKGTKNVEEESSFVASIVRLWENKTPKMSSFWRKNKNESIKEKKDMSNYSKWCFGISKMESLNILPTDYSEVEMEREKEVNREIILKKTEEEKKMIAEDEKSLNEEEKEMDVDNEEDDKRDAGDEAVKNCEIEEDSVSGKPNEVYRGIIANNAEFSGERRDSKRESPAKLNPSPVQSPPLLVLTPSTPIPISQTVKKADKTTESMGGVLCSIETIKTIDHPTPVCSSVGSMARREMGDNSETRKSTNEVRGCDNETGGDDNSGTNITKDNNYKDTDRDLEKKKSSALIEDSPLPPKPIRRLTGADKEGNNRSENYGGMSNNKNIDGGGEDRTHECEQTPVLKGGNLENTPREKGEDKANSKIDDGTGEEKMDFARPERLSYMKRSGLRSILNHSANRALRDSNVGLGSASDSRSKSFHLVKTPTGKYGLSRFEADGKDKQQRLFGLGESPCRRYHKRLKLLPPINPEECYDLTESESEASSQTDINGDSKVNRTQKRIPLWARSMNWIPKIKEQRNVDPFSIFGDSCMFMDLEDVFQRPLYISTVARDSRIKSWQNDRVASLNWSEDSLTSDELRQYKLKMDYYIDKSSEVYVTEPCFTPSPNPMVNGAWNHINKQRINSGSTTVIRKALNLSVHRLNVSQVQKATLQGYCSLDDNSENNDINAKNDFVTVKTNSKLNNLARQSLTADTNLHSNLNSSKCSTLNNQPITSSFLR